MSCENFHSALLNLFTEQKKCDVKFVCPDASSETGKSSVKAHKLILSLASDVFNTMFYGEASRNEVAKTQNEVSIDDIQFPAFKLFLSFIYSGSIDFETPEIAAEFYYAAHKYNSKDALKFINDYMLKEVKVENAIIFYDTAHLFENTELKDACCKVFSESTTAIITSQKFLSAGSKTVEAIFALDVLDIDSEIDLINALERYIGENKGNDREIAKKMRPAINSIRFLTLTLKNIVDTSLLTPEEALNVIGCLPPQEDLSKMPSGLSVNTKRRYFDKVKIETFRKLTDIFSTKFCYRCTCNGHNSSHAIWICGGINQADRTALQSIYDKYKHVSLMEYNRGDLKGVQDFYKKLGYVQ